MEIKKSFSPIISHLSEVLILGSLPGDLSIAKNEYYAHPQNRFWKILFQLFDQPLSVDYAEKVALLENNNIALWDVCHSAIRPGSMDTAISEVIPNNIPELISQSPHLKRIVFNGQKAEKLHDKYFSKLPTIQYLSLPSTSPANAQFNVDKLLAYWHSIKST